MDRDQAIDLEQRLAQAFAHSEHATPDPTTALAADARDLLANHRIRIASDLLAKPRLDPDSVARLVDGYTPEQVRRLIRCYVELHADIAGLL